MFSTRKKPVVLQLPKRRPSLRPLFALHDGYIMSNPEILDDTQWAVVILSSEELSCPVTRHLQNPSAKRSSEPLISL